MEINYVHPFDYTIDYEAQQIHRTGFVIGWDCERGFGEMTFTVEDGEWHCDSECMCSNDNKEFMKRVFDAFIDKVKVDD